MTESLATVSCVHHFATETSSFVDALDRANLHPDTELLFDVPIAGDMSLGGGLRVHDPSGRLLTENEATAALNQLIDTHLHRKRESAAVGADPIRTEADLNTLAALFESESLRWQFTGWRGDCDEAAAVKSSRAAVPCPEILQGNPFFPFCPKDYLQTESWAPNHGYWDAHWFAAGTAGEDHVLFMYTTWGSSGRLALFAGRDNSGFEINTYVRDSSSELQKAIGASANTYMWASDYPGRYLEDLKFDDNRTTWAIGTDQADRLVAGREYQNTIFLRAPQRMAGGLKLGLYGQVDLDMVADGDAGFFVDQACCTRSMDFGAWQSW